MNKVKKTLVEQFRELEKAFKELGAAIVQTLIGLLIFCAIFIVIGLIVVGLKSAFSISVGAQQNILLLFLIVIICVIIGASYETGNQVMEWLKERRDGQDKER